MNTYTTEWATNDFFLMQNKYFFQFFLKLMGLLTVLAISISPIKAETSMNDTNLINIHAYLEENKNYNGVVLIAKNKKILVEHASGYADLRHKVHNKISTKFQTASMAKMFTAVAIMRLVEAGKLNLEDTVGDFLPDYPNEIVKSKVTIHQLLTHKSGLSDYFNDKYDNHPKNIIKNLSDFLPFFENEPLDFIPGESSQYSNSGYLLLGLIVEKISGSNYYDHIKQTVFKPAGMNDTGWHSSSVVEGLAGTYEFSLTQNSWIETGLGGEIGSSAGGAYSTVHDFLAFANALNNYDIISKETLKLMTTDHNGRGYGYGFSLYRMDKEFSFGHSGGAPGVAVNLDVFTDSGYVAITLSNKPPMYGWYEARSFIRRELGGQTAHTDRFFNTQKVLEVFKKQGVAAALKQLDLVENKVSIGLMSHESDEYRKRHAYNESLEILQMMIKITPDDESVYSAMGGVFHALGMYEEAIKSYNTSIKLFPNDEVTEKLILLKNIIDEK